MSNFTLAPQIEAESVFVRDLPLSQLRLFRQKAVPWLCLIPRRADVREIYELNASDRALLMDEIVGASHALKTLFSPDKINVAALGNMVPQLHIHVVGRFTTDAAWPAPIWGRIPTGPRSDDEIAEIVTKLNELVF